MSQDENKPNGADAHSGDQTLAMPAVFINDFRYLMGPGITRVAVIEGDGRGTGHIRYCFVLPTEVILDLAKQVTEQHAKRKAREGAPKIVLPGQQ